MKHTISLFVLLAITLSASAQHFIKDVDEAHLKGPVKSVLTTVRTPQGRTVGQPVRNNFNEKGYYTQNTYYDTLGNPVIIVAYSYDDNDRLVRDIRSQEPNNVLLSQTTYKYDESSYTITAEMFGIADSLEEKTVYSYSKSGVLQKAANYGVDGKEIAATLYSYNDLGYCTYVTFNEGENGIYRGAEKYRYDTDGHIAEKCSYYLTTLRQAFLYTYYYDDHGNWTQAYVYHVSPSEGYLYQVITRQISYFE
jgi:hypothetical protein